MHISNLMEQADNFDIIHNNFDFLPLAWSGMIKIPMVTLAIMVPPILDILYQLTPMLMLLQKLHKLQQAILLFMK